MLMDRETRTRLVLKFITESLLFIGAIILAVWSMWAGYNLLTGGFTPDGLRHAGILLLSVSAIILGSNAIFYIAVNTRGVLILCSSYRFYKTLIGADSIAERLELFMATYAGIRESLEAPIKARHINRQGKEVIGQWNAVNDWKVWDVHESRNWTGNLRWVDAPGHTEQVDVQLRGQPRKDVSDET